MEHRDLLTHSQEPAAGPYPGAEESSPRTAYPRFSGYPTNILYIFLVFTMHYAYLVHLILFDLIVTVMSQRR
jgi:hypothetical protein